MEKKILNFRSFMETARTEARTFIGDVLGFLNSEEVNGNQAPKDGIEIPDAVSNGLVITPCGRKDFWAEYRKITPEGIWVTPQNSPEETEPEFFNWEELDHENDILEVAEYLNDITSQIMAGDHWYDFQRLRVKNFSVGL